MYIKASKSISLPKNLAQKSPRLRTACCHYNVTHQLHHHVPRCKQFVFMFHQQKNNPKKRLQTIGFCGRENSALIHKSTVFEFQCVRRRRLWIIKLYGGQMALETAAILAGFDVLSCNSRNFPRTQTAIMIGIGKVLVRWGSERLPIRAESDLIRSFHCIFLVKGR